LYLARTSLAGPDGPESRILASDRLDGGWVDVRQAERLRLERHGATSAAARRLATAVVPSSMSEALAGGDAFLAAARSAASDGEFTDAALINALDPSGYRDFMVFERHFSFGYEWQGKPVPDVLYELPISYFGNPLSFIGPDEIVPWPHYTKRMDYELELGIVIGREGAGLTPEQALDHVVGLTILNDFSARDIQAREMTGNLGPSKGKHFACGTGPVIATLDELPESGLQMLARVNGETWCDASSSEMIWSIEEIVAWASQGEQLAPGMLLGSGTCNGGSTLELDRTLNPGDVIELEIEGLGVLRNTLGQPGSGWWPTPRERSDRAIST
jgi:2-keto-4-pentenoate hydratase/2-oxohepta-3-ene-1,7-dioic acid hydratase in catechol pathway